MENSRETDDFQFWRELGEGWASRTPPDLIFTLRAQNVPRRGISHFINYCPRNLLLQQKTPKPWKLFVSAKPKAQLYTQPKNQVALILHFWLILPGHILKPNGLNY